jgi:carbamoyl-phosphate synthase small subunit
MLQNLENFPSLNNPSAALILENGEVYWGIGCGSKTAKIAELCFNTSQTGYQEILTDPSYKKQIITFTFPHIGIVGTNELDLESKCIHASGCVINQPIHHKSNWRATSDLDLFLKKNNTPCITNIDTRQLTRLLATKGAIKAAIVHFDNNDQNLEHLKSELKNWSGLENLDLASVVSSPMPYNSKESLWNVKNNSYEVNTEIDFKVTCLDLGIKKNILRNLNNLNFLPTVLPLTSTLEEIIASEPKGIFLSNGPGDPSATAKLTLPTIKALINKKIPIFGICLGHQILSLALGAKTKKMFQGHRGGNHPVKNLENSNVEITSQNHGFEVDRNTFSEDIVETHISLFDGTNEGIRHKSLPIFSVQYHPEASPGPHDSHYLFKKFYRMVKNYA